MTSWEVSDPALGPVRAMEEQEVLQRLATGNLGMYAQVRRPGESQWTPISQAQEFHPLCPFINSQYASNRKISSLNGGVTISNNLQNLVSMSSRVRSAPEFYNRVGFHAPIFDLDSPGSINTSGRVFRLWDNFWVGPLVTPAQANLGGTFTLYLYALNIDSNPQEHELHPYDYPIPEEEKSKLTLTVPPGALVLNKVRIPVSQEEGLGVHVLTFRTVTTSGKVAKGLLVGALTLGSVMYKQGHKGFNLSLRVVPPVAAPANPTTGQ